MPNSVIIRRMGGLVLPPLTASWIKRAQVNGSAVSAKSSIIKGMATFEKTLAGAGLTSRIYHMNLVAPVDIFAMRTPFIKVYGNDPWVRKTLGSPASGDTVSTSGWVPSGDRANCYVYDSGVIPNNVTQWTTSNGGLSYYIATSGTTNKITNGVAGTFDGTNYFDSRPDVAGFNQEQDFVFDASNGIITSSDHNGGFYMTSRTATNVHKSYRAWSGLAWGQSGATNTSVSSSGKPTTSCYAGGDNYPSSVIHGSAVLFSYWGWHDGFSSADGQTLFNAVQALRTAWGGGFL